MNATKRMTTGKWAELAELDAAVKAAGDRVKAIELEQAATDRKIEAAMAPLREYHERVGAGEIEFDADVAAPLEAEVDRVSAGVTFNVARSDRGTRQRLTAVNPRLEAQLAGALRTRQAAEQARSDFLRVNVSELGAEIMGRTVAARDGLDAAWKGLRTSEREWLSVLQLWARLVPSIGLDATDLPPHPLRGLTVNLDAGVALPMPAALAIEEGATNG